MISSFAYSNSCRREFTHRIQSKIGILIPNTNRIGEIQNRTPKMLIRTPLFRKWLNCTNSVYYMRNKTSPALIRSQFSLVPLCYTGRVAIATPYRSPINHLLFVTSCSYFSQMNLLQKPEFLIIFSALRPSAEN